MASHPLPRREMIRAQMESHGVRSCNASASIAQTEAKPKAMERYGSVRSAIVALHKTGMKPVEISRQLKCDYSYALRVIRIETPDAAPKNTHSRKPTLGYPSRKDAILALHDQGKRTADIALMLGKSQSYVAGVLSEAARTRRNLPDHVVIGLNTLNALRPAAVRRGMTPKELCQRLIEVIAADGDLVRAVLDDQEDLAA